MCLPASNLLGVDAQNANLPLKSLTHTIVLAYLETLFRDHRVTYHTDDVDDLLRCMFLGLSASSLVVYDT